MNVLRRATVFDSSHANAVREAQRAQGAAAQVATEEAADRAWRLHHQALQEEARTAAAAAAAEARAEVQAAVATEKAILDDATRYIHRHPTH